jgi:RNA polymerase primary sigma factor
MATDQDKEHLAELFEKAEAQGYLTTDDVLETMPDVEDTIEQLDELLILLQEGGIEVWDDKPEVEEALDLKDDQVEEDTAEDDELLDLAVIPSDDAVGLYLKEMARVPLLTTDQEVRLARILVRGRAARRKLSRNGHGEAERLHLEKRIEEGRLAREHIIKANTRLVVSIAKKYIGRGVPFLDLIQEGNLGLMKAVL